MTAAAADAEPGAPETPAAQAGNAGQAGSAGQAGNAGQAGPVDPDRPVGPVGPVGPDDAAPSRGGGDGNGGGGSGSGSGSGSDGVHRGLGGRALLVVGVVVGAAAIAQVAYQGADWMAATTTVTTTGYPGAPVVELVADGDVSVSVGGSDQVVVEQTARTGFRDVTYSATTTSAEGRHVTTGPGSTADGFGGERLLVEHTCPRGWSDGVCRADLSVEVPWGTSVVVRSGSGAIRAEGVSGALDLETSDGDVSVLAATGTVQARTSSGHVDVDGAGGPVRVSSGDGRVSVRDASRSVEARTSSGDVLVDGAGGTVTAVSGDGDVDARQVAGSAAASTSSGAVRVSGVRGDVTATTGDGPVVVRGTGTAVALEISTGDGRSTVDAPTDPSATRTVTIRSSSGDVSYLGAE